jgi:mannose-1-phosphate guanylyltransferase
VGVHEKIGPEAQIRGGVRVKAVMLVGGLGTRLRPLTLHVKKELMPVANRPFLEHVLHNLGRHGVDEAILTTGYLAEAFESFESASGVKLTVVRETTPLDTCGAVKNVESMLQDTFLVCNGDILTDLDITSLVKFHRERDTLGTITLTAVEDPSAYGLVPIDEDGRIERFIEKPRPDEIVTNLINAGTYVLEPEILNYLPAGVPFSFERVHEGGLFPLLLAEGEALYGFPSNAYWLDIGTPEKYLRANSDAVSGLVGAEPPGVRREAGVWIARGSEVDATARVTGPACVGEDCRIGARAVVGSRACIGDGCVIAAEATVDESVLHTGVRIETGAFVVRSIIGADAVIGAGSKVSDAVVGSGVVVGQDNELAGGIRLWPGIEVPDKGISFSR